MNEVGRGGGIISIMLYWSKLTTCICNNWLWGITQRAWAQFCLVERLNDGWVSWRLGPNDLFTHLPFRANLHPSLMWLLHSLFSGVIIRSSSPAPVLNLRMHPPSPSAPTCPIHFLPVRATNPLRLRFTLSPYLIPLNPQLPPWLLTEHDSLWIALLY